MKSRKPTGIEQNMLKRFFTEDAMSLSKFEYLDAMVFADEVVSDKGTDIVVYDIDQNIKYVVMVVISVTEDGLLKTLEDFLIDLSNDTIELATEIDYLV